MKRELDVQWQANYLFQSASENYPYTQVFNVVFFRWDGDLKKREGTIYFTNIFFLLSFLVGAVSTSTMIALSVNAVIAADITAYTLIATSILSIIVGAAMIGMYRNLRLTKYAIAGVSRDICPVLMSTLIGYLSYHIFITNSILNSMPILGQAGISAGFSLIIPIIGSALYAFGRWDVDSIKIELVTKLLPWLIGTALGTFSAVAINIEADSMMLNMATEVLTGCAIAIVTTVVLSWFLSSIIIETEVRKNG